MKKSLVLTLIALLVVSMLAIGCKKEEAVSDTAATDTTMTTGDTAMTDTMATDTMATDTTPDSSRFWPRASYQPGGPQPSFDKQYVRDYLESIHWDKRPPAPALPPEVMERTSEKYREAYRVLTGKSL